MFCYQCEQTKNGVGCTAFGICGKDSTTAALQDVLLYVAKGISMYAHRARQLGAVDAEIDRFAIHALFTTVTNVNFDSQRLEGLIRQALDLRARARSLYETACQTNGKNPESLSGPADWDHGNSLREWIDQQKVFSIDARKAQHGEDVVGLQELLVYGLKGAAAYADHAQILGIEDEAVWGTFHEMLDYLASDPTDINELTGMCLRCGEMNLRVVELLDKAHTSIYGVPEPTAVRVEPLAGKAILISGHDLKDLEELLVQTQDKGINVYTHGEMLPAHGYPELKKYSHLVGNYGGAWQDQQKEFDAFPGAILMTTNCIQKPRDSYKDRIFTAGLVAWPGVTHIHNRDFSAVIDAALQAPGFSEDGSAKTIMVGFARNAVLGVADKVIEVVKAGNIRHFFLIGGCDGAKPGRNYFTDLAQQVPDDCVILTLACGKYRFNKLEFGDIGGIPRLLDIGQCNDAYSAVQIALALADVFETDVNSLPLSFILSWYEQKAVAILLSLLHLGIKNIRLGPSLPAFVTPPVLDVLVENFNIMPISSPEADLQAILG